MSKKCYITCSRGHIILVENDVHTPMRQIAACERCETMRVIISPHECHWVSCQRKCAESGAAWMCDLCAQVIFRSSKVDPNSDILLA